MANVGSYEAKTHLPSLLDRVVRGETITITKHGKPVARLVPVLDQGPAQTRQTIEAMKAFQRKDGPILGDDLSLRDLIEEGRRY